MTALEQVKHIIEALQERKGQEIEVLKVEQLTTLTEYFVFCSATSTTQVKALADSVEFHMKNDHDIMVHHTEGFESAQWILLDFGAVVVHIFLPESRKFYNLENLWKDGVPVALSELGLKDESIITA
jgi:ribosome-associated protein